MRASLFILPALFTFNVFAAGNCKKDLGSVEAIAAMLTLNQRSAFDEQRNAGPELRKVIVRLFSELAVGSPKVYSPKLDRRLHLADKTDAPRAGVTALCLDDRPVALIKWETREDVRTRVYQAMPASTSPERDLFALRAALYESLGRTDPWVIPADPRGLEYLDKDNLILDSESATGVSESGLREMIAVRFYHPHGEFARLSISQADTNYLVSVSRSDKDNGERKLWRFEKSDISKIASFALIQISGIAASRLYESHSAVVMTVQDQRTMFDARTAKTALTDGIEQKVRGALSLKPGL